MTPAEHAYLSLFIGNFAAREDAYVLRSQEHVNETLTPDVLQRHWAQGSSVSVYTADGALTQVGAIDLDEGDVEDARPIADLLTTSGIPALLCPSRRGAHIWTFHSSPEHGMQEARIVRSAMQMAVDLVDWGYSRTKAEVFPRRGASPFSAGALRLPLMPHPKDGEVRPVYGPEGEVITRIGDLIEVISGMTADPVRARAFSGIDSPDTRVSYPGRLDEWRKQHAHDDAPTVSALLSGLTERPYAGRACLCPFHDDHMKSLSISADDERAFCKQPACDLYNDGRGIGSFQLERYIEERGRVAHA